MDQNFIVDVLRHTGDPVPAYEMLSAGQQRFFNAIVSDEDLVAVLRGHLYVEADVNDLLEQVFPKSSALIADLTYEQKIRRLKKTMALPADLATLLKALGELRNSFAHSVDRLLTESDDDRFFGALGAGFRPGVEDLIAQGAFPPGPGARVRAAIIVLHTGLCALRLAAESQNQPT